MKEKEIPLEKRNGKVVIYMLAGLFCLAFTTSLTAYTINNFSWPNAILALLISFGFFLTVKGLYQYFTYKRVKMIIAFDGEKIWFYNTNSKGTVFNRSQDITVSQMGCFYIVKTRTRYQVINYSFTFEDKGSKTGLFSNNVYPFPSLFETNNEGRSQVLDFVKEVAPAITLGYETPWQRAKRR